MKMSRSKEVAFINQSLLLHKGPAIQKFSLTFLQPNAERHHVDSWIYFDKTRNVNELDLDFSDICQVISSVHRYRLPHFLFSSTSVTVLSLVRCEIHFPVKFKLGSLKALSLEQVYFSGGEINDLTDSTPILESLSLTDCKGFTNLYVYLFSGSKITTLKIHESDQCCSNSVLSISADYSASFELVTSMSREYYFINKMKSLESASFGCNKVICGQYKADKEILFSQFLIMSVMLNVLDYGAATFSSYSPPQIIQALYRHEEQSLNCLTFDASCLAIKTDLTKGELPGIGYMLRHSPNIKTLIINIDKIHAKKDVKIYNFLKNLEVLESKHTSTTENFLAHLQNDMNFLRFLLKNSKVMERMTITTFKNVKFECNSESKKLKLLFQLTQELLAFSGASQAA
ncbi:hypothetical protein RHMOL_Rhmol06G0207300 [Rhododendron molle]|uniref:Uncharacterized protein n=1 Tax=Rhododendron molle TaxID=49168 RepID=A0ACC0NEE9_RHOML|nr:hypothetical protein RHMOL_Rhmol06G0207300 [Rhododendron molle]